MRSATWATFVAGLWLIVAPMVLGQVGALTIAEDVTFGILIACFSLWAATTLEPATGQRILVLLFGIWVLAAPYVLGYSGASASTRNDTVVGIIVLILSVAGIVGAERPIRAREQT